MKWGAIGGQQGAMGISSNCRLFIEGECPMRQAVQLWRAKT